MIAESASENAPTAGTSERRRRRRNWRKLHLRIDGESRQMVAALVATPDWSDEEILLRLLEQIEESIAEVNADGAFDTHTCYKAIGTRGSKAVIPPARTAVIW